MPLNETETRFAVLLFTDIVGSTDLKARHGVPLYSAALRVHNDHFERIARECRGIRILQNMGDGYFAEAGGVAEAVRFALLFQDAMRAGPWKEIQLTTRVGIHAGEVTTLVTESGNGIVAPAADLAARVMSLAVGGQILLTRFPFDEARHFLREHPTVAGRDTPPLRWLAHGPYLLKGRDEPMEIFEVGAEGFAPLVPPPDSEKAKRAIRPGEEETLGWRPAIGLEIPGRTGWKLIEQLGTGGFGEVWTGEHTKLHQRRAFKFCFDDERLRALKREVTLVRLLRTALGDRDDIVRFHELKLDEPPFYLESDLAPHGNLLQWAEKQGGLAAIPLAQRTALVAHTATALAAAHSIGVLHKDIKPTNILIFDAPDGTVRPRLVDFGIGTLADPAVLGQHGVTAAGFTHATTMRSTGTPTYSPPEYLAGKPYTVQGDIYGLGVLLYQLITADSSRPIAPGWERDITDPLLRGDIAACVDGDPARRLPSAADLADRLFHLDQRRAEIAEKERLTREAAARAEAEAAAAAARCRAIRFRRLAGAFAALALLAIAGGFLAWANQRKANASRAEVSAQKKEIERKNAEYRAMLVEAARSDCLIAEEKHRVGRELEAFAHLARACEYDPVSTHAAEQAVYALNTWNPWLPELILAGSKSAQFSPDGNRIVTVSDDNTVRVWNVITGKAIATLAGHQAAVRSAQFSPDGMRIVTASHDQTARVWDSATGKLLATLNGHAGSVGNAQFSPDGSRIVTWSLDNTAKVWDATTSKELVTVTLDKIWNGSAQLSPDGARIVATVGRATQRVWDLASGKPLATLTGRGKVHFSRDGSRIVTASDMTARVWDAASGKLLVTLSGEAFVWDAQFNPAGSLIVTASADKTARLWDSATGALLITLNEHDGPVDSAEFSPDGTRIVTASEDGTARLWSVPDGKPLATLPGAGTAHFSPNGMHVVSGTRVWGAVNGEATGILAGHEARVANAQFSPDGNRIVTASDDKTARVWDSTTGKAVATLTGHQAAVTSARFSPDGTRVVTGSDDKTARVWDPAGGKLLVTFIGHQAPLRDAQISPDGRRIVTTSEDKTARMWDATTGKSLTILAQDLKGPFDAQFSRDGNRIVLAAFDDTARVWDALTGNFLLTLTGLQANVYREDYSPDGSRKVHTAYWPPKLMDTNTGKEIADLVGHGGPTRRVQFNADGTCIVTVSGDTSARVWDAATGRALATLVGHDASVVSAQFSRDGTRIVTASQDKTARLWNILPPRAGPPPEWFPDFLRYMAQMRLNTDGELETLKTAGWLALRERLRAVRRASANADTPYLRILRKYVGE